MKLSVIRICLLTISSLLLGGVGGSVAVFGSSATADCPRYTLVGYETQAGTFHLLDIKKPSCAQTTATQSTTDQEKNTHGAPGGVNGSKQTPATWHEQVTVGIGTVLLASFLIIGHLLVHQRNRRHLASYLVSNEKDT